MDSNKMTLKQLRGSLGMTQAQFAEYVNMPLTSYRRYEKNTSKIEVGKLCDICTKLEIPLEKVQV